MNEDGTAIEEVEDQVEVSTDNISAADGGVTTTADEVADILHLSKPSVEAADDEDEEEDNDEVVVDDAADDVANAGEEEVVEDKPDVAVADDVVDPDVKVFELVIEDVNGEKLTLKPDDDIEEALKDFEPKNNGQIFKILDDLHTLRDEKKAHDAQVAEDSEKAEKDAAVAKITESFNSEIKALQGAKRLPVTTDGSISEREQAVWDFMGEENDKREKDGRPLLRSLEDALDKLELKEHKEAEVQKAKEEKELAKKRGSMVGGSSAPASNGTPVYQAGSARTANEAISRMGLIKK